MMELEDICDIRPLTPSELGEMIAVQRKDRGWTQETLAEIAGITVRTLQRVETGQSSSVDTRRALARAFEWPDIDLFNKPWPLPNLEKFRQEKARLDRETVEIPIEPLTTGMQIRELAELAQASAFHPFGDMPEEVQQTFAELQDYYREYGDVDDCYSATQKLDVNRDFQRMIDTLADADFVFGGGTRRVRLVDQQPTDKEPLRLMVTYLIATPRDALPKSIRAPRSAQLGF
jgi:transcriptional regulator with XRE-family HTH domain